MHEHGGDRGSAGAQGGPTVILIGQPNVGKSVIFGRLTGKYAVVSNYPGTSVEVTTGSLRIGERTFTVIDTPGINSLHPHFDDERVTRDILLERRPDVLIGLSFRDPSAHVVPSNPFGGAFVRNVCDYPGKQRFVKASSPENGPTNTRRAAIGETRPREDKQLPGPHRREEFSPRRGRTRNLRSRRQQPVADAVWEHPRESGA